MKILIRLIHIAVLQKPFSRKLETVGRIPKEVSGHTYFYIKEEGGRIDGSALSKRYRPSPIPSGGR